jgi:[NiFe] hydrogenase diaphorase moiety large subunit
MIPTHHGKLTFASIEPTQGLRAAIAKPRSEIIAMISQSGLKGRGGAGFPTGVKWNLCAAARGADKNIICNADEGEPGTYKDRIILTQHASLVIEGMTIAAYAIGARRGRIYLRGEYAYLRQYLLDVLQQLRESNLLGDAILGTAGFSFDIDIFMGSGSYVCGEETALIESLEGHRGEPRNRPPFPVDTGFRGEPTVVNNVETFAWAACILSRGADWFKGLGTAKSPGLKLFSVSGDCARPGVYEFPLGITVAELLLAVGAGNAKAVQLGGASGNCVPSWEFERMICFEDVSTGGSVIVFGPTRDMLTVAENFLEFFVEESCGQCTPCRVGNVKLLEGVRMLQQGRCSTRYLKELCELGETMQLASKCGLGQSSPNAFLSIVKHFKSEIMGRPATAATA